MASIDVASVATASKAAIPVTHRDDPGDLPTESNVQVIRAAEVDNGDEGDEDDDALQVDEPLDPDVGGRGKREVVTNGPRGYFGSKGSVKK